MIEEDRATELFDELFPKRPVSSEMRGPASETYPDAEDFDRAMIEQALDAKDTFGRLFALMAVHWERWRRERGMPPAQELTDKDRSRIIFHIKRATSYALNELDYTIGSQEHADHPGGFFVQVRGRPGSDDHPVAFNFEQLQAFFELTELHTFEDRLSVMIGIINKSAQEPEHGEEKFLNLDAATTQRAARAALDVMEERDRA